MHRHPRLADDLRSLWATAWIAEEMARVAEMPATGEETVAPRGTAGFAAPPAGSLRFGEFELLEELGRGGMGVVSRAVEISRGRVVAIKRLLRGPDSSSRDIDRFRVEAQAASRLAHPHVVPIFQVGECDDQPYFTMQLVEGTTLARKLADGPMPGVEAARLLIPVCRAIQYAHDRGVLHRDLKPSNILIDLNGNPYVSDFGLAKRIDVDPALTPSGALVGTPSYMAPEQAGSPTAGGRAAIGPASDVYGLGAILYQMLAGRPPFQAATAAETILLALEHDPISPGAQPPGQPRPRDDRAQVPPEVASTAVPDRVGTGRGPRGVPPRRSGLGPLDEPPRPGRTADGRDPSRPGRRELGRALDLPRCRLDRLLRRDQCAPPRGRRRAWPYVLIFSVGLCGWAAIFWALRRRGGPIRFVEKQLAHVWGAGIVSINLIFLVEWLLGMPVLSLSPMIAVTNGMLFMIKGGILSGDYYLQAALTFSAIFPMAAFPASPRSSSARSERPVSSRLA